ncbi:hypothetical protein [Alicycliphilus denitrificans]|uniref:hypothetical protein n=1 Tax=Alicycliphilus denitrificans TaxID=179636 RepID=UPI0001DA0228|nr:hypothetical protein [Alicycliphilus denitrificans]ADU99001.1 hypothetical protein Alide_1240 [Alicycliphilus denitrificans BC]
MNATRTEPRQHCYQRPMDGGYVPAAATTTDHLRAVFAAERERLAAAARPRRKRRQPAAPEVNPQQAQLQLVA